MIDFNSNVNYFLGAIFFRKNKNHFLMKRKLVADPCRSKKFLPKSPALLQVNPKNASVAVSAEAKAAKTG